VGTWASEETYLNLNTPLFSGQIANGATFQMLDEVSFRALLAANLKRGDLLSGRDRVGGLVPPSPGRWGVVVMRLGVSVAGVSLVGLEAAEDISSDTLVLDGWIYGDILAAG